MGEIDGGFAVRVGGNPPDDPSPRRNRLVWLGLGIAALVVFELTADPALAVVVGCLKFGWDDLATARWLRRADSDRLRGRVTARFYAAWSLWRISAVGLAMMIVIVFATAPLLAMMQARGKQVPDVPREFVTVLFVALFGMIASSLLTLFAIATAWRNGVKVWVGPEAKSAKLRGDWPPLAIVGRPARTNRVHWMALGLLSVSPVPITLGVILVGMIDRLNMPIILVGGFLLVVIVGTSIGTRVAARTPEECWPLPDLVAAEEPPLADIVPWLPVA